VKQLSAKGRVTREKILNAANDLFYQYGYTATGLDRIIAEAGVAKGNFFHHFKSKEELAVAVLDWHRDLAIQEIDLERILAEPSPLQALRDLLKRMTGRMTDGVGTCRVRGCLFGNFALELSLGSEAVRCKVRDIFGGFRMLIQTLLERAQAAGEIRTDLGPLPTAGMILGLVEGAVLLDKASQSEQETGRALDFIYTYLRR
jgi:TetR/AcrR family transcriptional repressor of nem operon